MELIYIYILYIYITLKQYLSYSFNALCSHKSLNIFNFTSTRAIFVILPSQSYRARYFTALSLDLVVYVSLSHFLLLFTHLISINTSCSHLKTLHHCLHSSSSHLHLSHPLSLSFLIFIPPSHLAEFFLHHPVLHTGFKRLLKAGATQRT